MIILIVPMFSKQEVNADSNYVVISALVDGLLRVRPDYRFFMPFPDKESGYTYEDDGFFRHPAIVRIPQRISPRKQANAVTYDGWWYDNLFRTLAFDVVWCNLVEIAAHVSRAAAAYTSPVQLPSVIAAHNYVIHKTLPYPMEPQENLILSQLMGAVCADRNVFNSDHCRSMLMDNAAKYLSPEMRARISDSSVMIPYGTLEDSLEPDPTRAPNDVPVIAYNHRLQGYKNYEDTFDLLDELWKEGLRFRLRYLNNTGERNATVAKRPWAEIRLSPTRKEYVAALRGCDLNITNSQHETFCIAAIESMALGQPLVAPNGVTFPEITGATRGNGYPFLFNTREEQKRMVRQLIEDAELRRKWGVVASAHVRASYGRDLWAQRYAALFEKEQEHRRSTSPEDATEFFRATLRSRPSWELMDLVHGVRNKVVSDRVPFSNQSFAPVQAMRMARTAGYKTDVAKGRITLAPA